MRLLAKTIVYATVIMVAWLLYAGFFAALGR